MLKDILRGILPQALFLTWEVLAQEHQAPGNDAYLGVYKLAQARKRTDRKVRMDLDDLQGRQLLTIRYEWKIFREADGTMKAKPVAIKDFERLYDLAYEYLQWTRSDSYVPPEREFVDFIRENEPLMRKLMRFDNYRRLLCNKKPGRETQEREIHQWYKSYDEAVPPLPSQSDQTQEHVEEVQAVKGDNTGSILKESLQESLQESLKKPSIERRESNENKEELDGDSFDSVVSSEERDGAGADYTKLTPSNEVPSHEETPPTLAATPMIQTNSTKLPNFVSKKGPAKQATVVNATRLESAELDPAVQSAKAAMQSSGIKLSSRKNEHSGKLLPPPNALASAFLSMCSDNFHDQNPSSSETYILRVILDHRMTEGAETLACLVRAYVYARDKEKIDEKYHLPDGENRMPLFCTMFKIYADQWMAKSGRWKYSQDNLEADIDKDCDLTNFCYTYYRSSRNQTEQPVVTTMPQSEASLTMSQTDAEELAREILRDAASDGVTEAIPHEENGRYVVLLTWQGILRTMNSPQEWRTEWAGVRQLLARREAAMRQRIGG